MLNPSGSKLHGLMLAFAAACITCAPVARAADTWYGPEFLNLARASVDVMKLQHLYLARQSELDAVPVVVDSTAYFLPSKLHLNDGMTRDGFVARGSLYASLGAGKPGTGYSVFGGLAGDLAEAKANGAYKGARYAEEMFFLGGSAPGVQVSGGFLILGQTWGFDKYGYFAGNGGPAEYSYRPGTPPTVGSRPLSESEQKGKYAWFLSARATEGVTLGALFGSSGEPLDSSDVDVFARQMASNQVDSLLKAARAELTPAGLFRRMKLRERFGLPGIGLDHYARGIDYWGDQFARTRQAFDAAMTGAAAGPQAATVGPAPAVTEIPVFYDDLLGTGISVRAVSQVAPSVMLRQAAASWTGRLSTAESHELFCTLRAQTFRRADAQEASGDAAFGVGLKWISFAVSASYNRPDSSAFFPVPKQMVIGFQTTFINPRMARPIVPGANQVLPARQEGEAQ